MALASTHVRYFDEPADNRIADPLLYGAHGRAPRMQDRAIWFYAHRFDRRRHKLSERSLADFIEENREDALAQGLEWKPAPSTLRRAIRQMAEVGANDGAETIWM